MTGTVYVVCRTGFGTTGSAKADQTPTYEGGFLDRDSAEEFSRHLDTELLLSGDLVAINPLREHRLDELTSLPERALRERLQDAGVSLPATSDRPTAKELTGLSLEKKEEAIDSAIRKVWVEWWDRILLGGGLPVEQKRRVWEAFDLYTFHTIREVDAPGTRVNEPMPWKVYAVVQNHWEYNDSFYDESEAMLRVYRAREEAEAECHRLNIDTQPSEGSDESYSFKVVTLILNPGEG